MANPSGYTPGYSFDGFQELNPTTPLPASQVDSELADIAAAINDHKAAIEDVRRSDGALKNEIVTPDTLSAATLAMIVAEGGSGTPIAADGVAVSPTVGGAADVQAALEALADGSALATNSVLLEKLATQAQATLAGRAAGAGTGSVSALTATQATAILNEFTSALKGLVPASGGSAAQFLSADGTFKTPPSVTSGAAGYAPASGGGTTNFLRADGTWAEPPGGGSLEVHTPVSANTGPVAVTIGAVTAPIRKRLRSRDGINTTNFGGAAWLSRAADLTGIADGKQGLLHFVVDFTGGDGTNMTIITNGNGRFKVFKGTDNRIRFLGYDSAGLLIFDMRTNNAILAASGVKVVTASWNLATSAALIYVNGVADKFASSTIVNSDIDYTATRWDIAADNGTQFLNADLGHILFDDGFVDISDARELRRFQTANGLCAYMPAGRVFDSYATKPLLFLTGNTINILHNHGSAGNATPFTKPSGTPTNGGGVNGSLYKDLAANDLQANGPILLQYDSSEGVWVAPIGLKLTKYAQDYGATGTTETFPVPLNTTKLTIYGQGPGGGGGGGATNHGGGGGGSGARGFFRFAWIAELGGVDLSITTRAGATGGAGNGAGNGTDGTTPTMAVVDFPDTLGGVQIQFGAGQGGKGGTTTGGRGGRGGNIATTTVDQGGSDYWPDGVGVTQFNLGSGFGETGFNTSGGEGAGEGDAGGGGGGGNNTAAGETSQGSYYHIEWEVEE